MAAVGSVLSSREGEHTTTRKKFASLPQKFCWTWRIVSGWRVSLPCYPPAIRPTHGQPARLPPMLQFLRKVGPELERVEKFCCHFPTSFPTTTTRFLTFPLRLPSSKLKLSPTTNCRCGRMVMRSCWPR